LTIGTPVTSMHDVLHIDQAAQAQVACDAHRVVDDVVEIAALQALRGINRIRIAGVHARALDVLHNSGDDDCVAVGNRVDLDLGALQVLVDEHLPPRHCADRPAHIPSQLFAVAHDLHRAPAEHIRRAHQDRIAGALGDRLRLFDAGCRTAHRLRDADRIERSGERAAILGQVDRLDARAHDGDALFVELLGEIDRGLTAELDERPGRALSPRHVQRTVEVERFEVQAV
jgi:hypothetical protein